MGRIGFQEKVNTVAFFLFKGACKSLDTKITKHLTLIPQKAHYFLGFLLQHKTQNLTFPINLSIVLRVCYSLPSSKQEEACTCVRVCKSKLYVYCKINKSESSDLYAHIINDLCKKCRKQCAN